MPKHYNPVAIKDHAPINVGIFHARITSDTLDDPTPRFYGDQLVFPNMAIRLLDPQLGFVRHLYLHVEGHYNVHPLVQEHIITAPDVNGNWLCEQLLKSITFVTERKASFHFLDGIHTLDGIPNADLSDYDLGVMGYPDLIEVAKGIYMCVNPTEITPTKYGEQNENTHRCVMQLEYKSKVADSTDDVASLYRYHNRYHNLYTIYDHLAITPLHMDSGTSAEIDEALYIGIEQAIDTGMVNIGIDTATFESSYCSIYGHTHFIEPIVKHKE